jgi:hypothetical protein
MKKEVGVTMENSFGVASVVLKGVNIKASPEGFDDGDVLMTTEAAAMGRDIVFGRGMLKDGTVLNRLPRDIVQMFS